MKNRRKDAINTADGRRKAEKSFQSTPGHVRREPKRSIVCERVVCDGEQLAELL